MPEATALARRARAIPARDQGDVRAHRRQGRRGVERRRDAARSRRRPLGRARDSRWARHHARRRRGALDRRPWGHQHARDEPERERARDAARGGAWNSRGRVRERRLAAARGRSTSGSRCSASGRSTPASGSCSATSGVRVFTMSEIDRVGVERACARRSTVSGPGFVHVSLDIDALDPRSRRASARRCGGADLPRGAPRARAGRRVGSRRLARGRRGESDPRPREHHGRDRRRARRERARQQII